jgi:RNA polymerase sigma-70 factor (ECF subfamily)
MEAACLSRPDSPAAAGPDLVAIVRAAQRGDRAAFGTLYARYGAFVHGVLLAHAEPGDVADLVQDVFLTALERLPSLRQPAAFGSWLAAIARNHARMERRRRAPHVALPEELPAPPTLGPDGAAAFAALTALPETYREPLLLRLVEGLSGAEIAERLGLTHGTVRVYLHRGLAMLRERLGGQDG